MNAEQLGELLSGKTIDSISEGNDVRQNDFIINFTDGTKLEVTAIGDDMTYIELQIRR